MNEPKTMSICVEEGIDEETGLSYTKWVTKKCGNKIPCMECKEPSKNYDRYNDICTIRSVIDRERLVDEE